MDFVPIRVSTLRGDQKIPFDTYVKVGAKHILYCRRGDHFEGDRLKRLKDKKLKKMFIADEDETSYRQYLHQNIELAYSNSGKSIETRASIIQGAQQAATEDLMEDPHSVELYHVAKSGSEKYVNFILNEELAFKSILDIQNSECNVSHHGVNVATFSVAMAHKMGLSKDRAAMMSSFVLGCLLHDYAHQDASYNLATPPKELPKEEFREYQLHPERSVEKVKNLKHFDKLVLDVMYQHEELIDGSGFPKKMKEKDLDVLVLVASTANAFDRMASLQGFGFKNAMKKFLIERLGLHPLGDMKALQDVLKEKGML